MTQDLHRLIYISHANGDMPAGELDRILASARAFNPTLDVTGLLLFHHGSFLQVLEGTSANLSRLMLRIRSDRRHGGVIVMQSAAIDTRAFADWSMGFVPMSEMSNEQREGAFNLLAFAQARSAASQSIDKSVDVQVTAFLSTFREFEAV